MVSARFPLLCDASIVSDAPHSFTIQPRLDRELAKKIDKEFMSLDRHRDTLISIVFLLVDDVNKALEICRIYEQGNNPFATGADSCGLFEALQYTGQTLTFKNWEVKIACVLHLLGEYRVLRMLGVDKSEAKRKFKGLERLFLNSFRVWLFKICRGLVSLPSKDADNFGGIFGPSFQNKNLETNFLVLMKEGRLTQENPENLKKLIKKIEQLEDSGEFEAERDDFQVSEMVNNELQMEREHKYPVDRGLCIIINQRKFYKDPDPERHAEQYEDRDCSDIDAESLRRVWERFRCDVHTYNDLTDHGMVQTLDKWRDKCNRERIEYDFLVVCIMSHGKGNKNHGDEIMGVNGVGVKLRKIESIFLDATKCRGFAGKPKLMFYQACRGLRGQPIVHTPAHLNHYEPDPTSNVSPDGARPATSDYIIGYSTIAGYAAFKKKNEGSFYIQLLCTELENHGHKMHLSQILEQVQGIVPKYINEQQPENRSTLTGRKLIFKVRRG